jgi:hypothetical protein
MRIYQGNYIAKTLTVACGSLKVEGITAKITQGYLTAKLPGMHSCRNHLITKNRQSKALLVSKRKLYKRDYGHLLHLIEDYLSASKVCALLSLASMIGKKSILYCERLLVNRMRT